MFMALSYDRLNNGSSSLVFIVSVRFLPRGYQCYARKAWQPSSFTVESDDSVIKTRTVDNIPARAGVNYTWT